MRGEPVILCALERERAALARRLGAAVEIVRVGPGPRVVEQAVERIARRDPTPALILAGVAGALTDLDGAHWASAVRNRAGEQWSPTLDVVAGGPGRSAVILGVETPALDPDAKRSLRRDTGADLVDCESHAFARACARHGLSWAVVRGVSDGAGESLPPRAGRWIDERGRTRTGRALADLLLRPTLVPAAARLARRSDSAMRAVADQVAAAVQRFDHARRVDDGSPLSVSEQRS